MFKSDPGLIHLFCSPATSSFFDVCSHDITRVNLIIECPAFEIEECLFAGLDRRAFGHLVAL
jgi:hypothetical protein